MNKLLIFEIIGGGTKFVPRIQFQGRRMLSTREGILFSLQEKRGERYLAFIRGDVL